MSGSRRTSLLIAAAVLIGGCTESARNRIDFWWDGVRGGYSVDERVQQIGPRVEARLRPAFAAAGIAYPPRELTYLAFKDTELLQVYARDAAESPWTFVASYPVHAASGHLGPKLVEGDAQVPEGIYSIALLNPNSRYHLSLRLSYPNEFDQQMAAAEGRSRLGGDIMIHGDHRSIGCLAMGNDASEDLFVLAALAATQPPVVIISPTDFRASGSTQLPSDPPWTGVLYEALRRALEPFPPPR